VGFGGAAVVVVSGLEAQPRCHPDRWFGRHVLLEHRRWTGPVRWELIVADVAVAVVVDVVAVEVAVEVETAVVVVVVVVEGEWWLWSSSK
jgi:hypothetical protein